MSRFPKQQAPALIGYARVSTLDQSVELQTQALKTAGCLKIFTDTASGATRNRPGLDDAMTFLREGDTLVVWRLDRLGRSLQELIKLLAQLDEWKVNFRSLQEHIETDSAVGRMFFHLVATFAEFERDLIRERTHHGLAVARGKGRFGGRKRILSDKKVVQAKALLAADTPFAEVCRTMNCSARTLRRYLAPSPPPPMGAGASRQV